MQQMKYTIVLTFDTDGEVWGSCDVDGAGIHTFADSIDGVVANVRGLIEDFKQNEFKNEPQWQDVDVNAIEFDFQYSLVDFFDQFNAIKISEIAKLAGINPALARAYANGDKNPSLAQAKKIEEAAHRLAQSLLRVQIVPPSVSVAA
jgi:predicted RNase H-like HicB family nuclease